MARSFERLKLTPARGDTEPLYEAPPWAPDQDLVWLETVIAPQSVQFMIDCLPAIRELTASAPRDIPIRVIDAGSSSGAGANLLGQLHASPILGPPMIVDAMELHPWMARYARAKFTFIRRYIIADVRNYWPEEPWDLAICSHTLEHIADWEPFVAALRRLASRWVLIYTPWKEDPRIAEHALTIDEAFLARAGAEKHWVIRSPAWYYPGGREAECVAFVLRGTAE